MWLFLQKIEIVNFQMYPAPNLNKDDMEIVAKQEKKTHSDMKGKWIG